MHILEVMGKLLDLVTTIRARITAGAYLKIENWSKCLFDQFDTRFRPL